MTALPLRLANAEGVPGTACALVRGDDGVPLVLTNHHVVFGAGAVAGDRVWAFDDGGAAVLLGRGLRGQLGRVTFAGETYFVDCALIGLSGATAFPSWLRDQLESLARYRVRIAARPGLAVEKVGPSTGHTHGVVTRIDYPDHPHIEGRSFEAPRQLLVDSADADLRFCGPGDSGSAVVDDEGRLLGLLWGSTGSGQGLANPIAPVLDCLAVWLEGEDR